MKLGARLTSIFHPKVEEDGEVVDRKYYVSKKKRTHISTGEFRDFFQIVSLREFTLLNGKTVKKGEKGGWVQFDNCLSHKGLCWIDENSYVETNSQVLEDACVVKGVICSSSIVKGKTQIVGSIIKRTHIVDSILKESYVHGACVMTDSNIEALKIYDVSPELMDEDKKLDCKFNRVVIRRHSTHQNYARIFQDCIWDDVQIAFSAVNIDGFTRFENVKGINGLYLDIEQNVELRHVHFPSQMEFVSLLNGMQKKKGQHTMIGTEESPIIADFRLSLSGEEGNLISGNVFFKGWWKLSNCSISDSVNLISQSTNEIRLVDSSLKDVSSIFVEGNKYGETLEGMTLSNDDCYRVSY